MRMLKVRRSESRTKNVSTAQEVLPQAAPPPDETTSSSPNEAVALTGEVLPVGQVTTKSRHHMTSLQLRHLAESARLEERPDHIGARLAIWAIAGSLVSLLVWAAFARLPEIARADGEIRPLGLERLVQIPEGGTLLELAVRDGDVVQEGQVIARIDDRQAQADLRLARQQARSLAVQEEWMDAFIADRRPDFTRLADPSNEAEIQNGLQAYEARVQSLEDRTRVLQEQILQIDNDLVALQGRIASQELRNASMSEVLSRREALFEKGLVTFPAIVASRQESADAAAQLTNLSERANATRRQREETTARLASLRSGERVAIRETLQATRAELAAARTRIANIEERVSNRLVRSPMAGTVTVPDDLAVGDFVVPGAPIAFLLPSDARLIARVRVPAADISRVETGQTARVKVSALNFTRFGRLSGTVDTLSPSALVSDQGEVFYSAEIRLDGTSLSDGQRSYDIRPGMQVEVEILNGSRTILAYLFKPVKQALDSAFTEE